jgi:hypothetical protein
LDPSLAEEGGTAGDTPAEENNTVLVARTGSGTDLEARLARKARLARLALATLALLGLWVADEVEESGQQGSQAALGRTEQLGRTDLGTEPHLQRSSLWLSRCLPT